MRFQADHDLHIHSYISPCAGHDPRQTKEAILAYGLTNGFRLLCVTDHIWDKKGAGSCQLWRGAGLDIEKGKEILPLPQSPRCRFLFGMEVDIDYEGNLAVTKEEYDTFDFLILAPSHLHITGATIDPERVESSAEERKAYYLEKLYQLLETDLPFPKCGLAHFTTSLLCQEDPLRVFDLITDQEYEQLWRRVAESGMGVEINFASELEQYPKEDWERLLRPYRIAQEMGCTFYLGGDVHSPEEFAGRKSAFEQAIDLLGLTEEDKFPFVKANLKQDSL